MASKKNEMVRLRLTVDNQMYKHFETIMYYLNELVDSSEANWLISDNENTYYQKVYQEFLSSFTDTYNLLSKELKRIYREVSDFTVNDLLDLTYKADGKTFKERFDYYWNEARNRLKHSNSKEVKWWLGAKYERILRTETHVIESKIKDKEKPILASLIVIDSGCEECQGGEFAIDEDVALPPFHPNCQCNWWYEETDNPDDIADLDLIIEE